MEQQIPIIRCGITVLLFSSGNDGESSRRQASGVCPRLAIVAEDWRSVQVSMIHVHTSICLTLSRCLFPFPSISQEMKLTSERDDVFRPLQEQQGQLVEAWMRTRRYFPSADESENTFDRAPTAKTLHLAVARAEPIRKGLKKEPRKRTYRQLRDLVDALSDHHHLLKFIPTGEKYVSLITGVVATVVEVSH